MPVKMHVYLRRMNQNGLDRYSWRTGQRWSGDNRPFKAPNPGRKLSNRVIVFLVGAFMLIRQAFNVQCRYNRRRAKRRIRCIPAQRREPSPARNRFWHAAAIMNRTAPRTDARIRTKSLYSFETSQTRE